MSIKVVPGASCYAKRVLSLVTPSLVVCLVGPILFSVLTNDLDNEAECMFSKFAGDTKLGGVADGPNGCGAIQRDFDSLGKWAEWNLMKIKKRKHQIPSLARNDPGNQDSLGARCPENSSAVKAVGTLVDTKLTTNQKL